VAEMVKVVLGNRTAKLVRPYPYEVFSEHLKFRVDGADYMPKVKSGEWDGYIKMLKFDSMGAGLFLAMREKLAKAAECQFVVQDIRRQPEMKHSGVVSDRTYQTECVEKMVQAKTGGLILNATGTGKTYIAGMYFSRLVKTGVFLVDELTLLKQAQIELSRVMGEDVGQVGKGVFDPKRITVATVQTMHLHKKDPRFLPWARNLESIIIDEVHLAMNRRNFETVSSIRPPVVFGLTATLELRKARVALQSYNLCGPVLFDYPLERGVQEGYLSPGMAVFVDFENDFEKQGGRWRFFNKGASAKEYTTAIAENQQRNALICSLIREAVRREKFVIVLVERIKHIQLLHDALMDVPHRVVCGLKKVEDRLNSRKLFEEGKIKLIIANRVFKKGIDIKKVNVILDAAAMRNKNDAVQKYGRGIRMCEGKAGLIYIDIYDKTPAGAKQRHRFETSAESRRAALKSRGIVSGRANAGMDPQRIFDRAELELKKLIDALPKKENAA
jgi:superfamily II DNA or RNA helicase